jgi:hypothetical protein
MALYSFAKIVAMDRLDHEIRTSAIKTALNNITSLGSDLSIVFNDTLDATDEAILIAIVNNHIATPLTQPNPTIEISKIPDPAPFALPTYRTKRLKTTSIETCVPSSGVEIRFKLPADLYSQGGAIVVQNARIGDYIYAEVEDLDGIIPEPYRAATCEAWPIVATYIEGQWVEVTGEYTVVTLDTRPLIALLKSNLYLCLHYVSTSEGIDRKVGVNYYMNKKL